MKYRQCFPFVVEDDDDFALILARAFQKAGVPNRNVLRYRNGEQALTELFSADAVRPSVALLDMNLPGMSGLSVLTRIRSRESLANLPAFFLTSSAAAADIASAQSLRAWGYWLKPSDVRQLQVLIEGILELLENPGRLGRLTGNLVRPAVEINWR